MGNAFEVVNKAKQILELWSCFMTDDAVTSLLANDSAVFI